MPTTYYNNLVTGCQEKNSVDLKKFLVYIMGYEYEYKQKNRTLY